MPLSLSLSVEHRVSCYVCISEFSARMHERESGCIRYTLVRARARDKHEHDGETSASAFRVGINLISLAFNRPVRASSGEFNLDFDLPLRAPPWNDYRII